MRAKGVRVGLAAAALLVVAIASPPPEPPTERAAAGGLLSLEDRGAEDELDARRGSVEPTAEQLAAVEALGAHALWNRFGTPSSLIRYGGHLVTGIQAPDPVAAARSFVEANRVLFRLPSAEALTVLSHIPLPGSDGHAVAFAQRFDGLRAAEGGLVVVGLEGTPDRGWDVAYASSTATGDVALAAAPSLSATEAFIRAAADVGREVSPADIGTVKDDREWRVFPVQGFSVPQRARLVAVPTPLDGVRPAWEVLLVDGDPPVGFQSFVDAATGQVLVRKDIVERSHPPGDTFAGQVPPADAACGPDHGPWTVAPGESVGAVTVSVEAVLTTNDAVLHLLRDGSIVASQDTLFSPEVLVWEPPPGDEGQGTYSVRVCDFSDGQAWLDPRDYRGTIAFSPVGGGTAAPYPPKWRVFPAYPPLGGQSFPWEYPSTDTRELWCWESTSGTPPQPIPGCDREVQNLASRAPWDVDPRTGAPTFTTRGNNASTAESWSSPLTPGPTGFRPFSLSREYDFPWQNQWFQTQCLPTFTPGVTQDVSATTVNLFVAHNQMHDWSYFLGFTERAWNAQESNFGTGGTSDRDPLLGDVQAGAVSGGYPSYLGRDNANMIPLPDGVPPVTNMYLWQPLPGTFYAPCVDGDFDMAVIAHEYGHLIENRMIGKGGTRSGHHAGAMGESFGDFVAAEYLAEHGFAPVGGENPFAVGAYVTANHGRAIRNYNMSWPQTGAFPAPGVAPQVNPLNFSAMGYDIVGQQVHANGEIWSAVNFDIRRALVGKYDPQFPSGDRQLQEDCARGRLPADRCPGNRRWIQLVFDAMLLMPPNPSMLVARDAYLAADLMRFGGANQGELWEAFARRGFGVDAASTNASPEGTAASDTDPKPDFDAPGPGEAVVTFRLTDTRGSPVRGRVYVGHYEARVSPIADTDPATGPEDGTQPPGASNLDDRAAFVPGTYEFTVQANGYGAHRFRVELATGARTLTLELPLNLASRHNGATATGDGTEVPALIDDTEATNWDDPAGGLPVNVANPQVTVDLAGDGPVTVDRVQVSAMLFGQNRFTALRQFRIEASSDGGATFRTVLTSAEDAFPGSPPRPVAPEMILREFRLPSPVRATHLRLVVLDNQCTGNPSFQGEQDADPANTTDCTVGAVGALPPRNTEVHVAELQAFGPPEADLAVDKRDSRDPAQRGQPLDYVITVTNRGPDRASDVTLVDDLPKKAGFAKVLTTKGSCAHKPSKTQVVCGLGDLAPEEVVTVTITVKPTDHETITDVATVSARAPADPNPDNNRDTETTVVV